VVSASTGTALPVLLALARAAFSAPCLVWAAFWAAVGAGGGDGFGGGYAGWAVGVFDDPDPDAAADAEWGVGAGGVGFGADVAVLPVAEAGTGAAAEAGSPPVVAKLDSARSSTAPGLRRRSSFLALGCLVPLMGFSLGTALALLGAAVPDV
jgi:hypothetical protein